MKSLLLLVALSAPAFADAKTKELATGYQKELAACKRSADGVAKVVTGTEALGADYATDLATLKDGQTRVQAFCNELDATIALCTDPNASYKALEHQLDEHDNTIRRLRKDSKVALDGIGPTMGKMIPIINAKVGAADPGVKKTPLKFPSGRSVDAPGLSGSWRVSGSPVNDIADYTEGKEAATLSVKLIDESCSDRKKSLPKAAVDASTTQKLAWYVAYETDSRRVHQGCRVQPKGSLLVTLDGPSGASWPQMESILFAMLATRE
ncbi:MAG: hypothetical protein QM831_26405 [Kofleriaceae bacterium]